MVSVLEWKQKMVELFYLAVGPKAAKSLRSVMSEKASERVKLVKPRALSIVEGLFVLYVASTKSSNTNERL